MQVSPNSTRRDLLKLVAALPLGAALLAACGGGTTATTSTSGAAATAATSSTRQAAAASTTLTLMIQTDPKQQTMYEKIVKPFTQAKVNIIQGGAGALQIQQKLLLLLSANTPPDVYWTHTYIDSGLASLGIPADLSSYMAKDKSFDDSDIFSASMKDFNILGKQYAFPRETTSYIMVYNKDLFQKGSVAEPTADWTWNDYVQTAQKLTSGSGATKVWGTAGWPNPPYVYPAIIRVWQHGGDVVNKERTTYTMDQTPGVEGIQDIADLIHKYKVHASSADLQGTNVGDLFNTGRIAMLPYFNVFGAFANAKFTWDIQHLPHGTKDQVTRVASAGHSMATASKQKELSWGLLKQLISKAAYEAYFADGLPVASKSVREAALKNQDGKPPAHIKIGIDALSYARPEPVVGNWIGIHQAIANALQGVYGPQHKDVKTVLTAVAPEVNQLIKAKPTATK
ncbi:MAG: sugar ABC transporter substrate-binding protein [Chloroflexi bacterium]|nr:sugar ABC transporter substrate-binding protein [Chloroflexota bacterium]